MKTLLFCSLFFFAANNSIAQTSVSDTTIHIRGEADYYIDGVLVCRSCESQRPQGPTRKFDSCPIRVITGGLPVDYGDLNSSIIQVNTTPARTIPRRTSDKEQKMATE